MSDPYLLLKSIHILGVIIFLGNIIVTGWWKFMADRTRDAAIIAFAQRQVTLTDFVFTTGGIVLILIGGMGNVILFAMDAWHTLWLLWGYSLFVVSGLIWGIILLPIQIKQARMTQAFAHDGVIPDNYWQLTRQWNIFGTIATVLPAINIYWMVFKTT